MVTKQLSEINVLLKSFSQRPIAYQRIYATITGSVSSGLLLSQVVYWWYACGERDFYKTDGDFRAELGLGPREMRTAKATLQKRGFISIYLKGVPSITHYCVHISALLSKITSLSESYKLVGTNRTNKVGRNVPTITETNKPKPKEYTEITRKEIIEKSSSEILDLDLLIAKEKKFFMEQLPKIFRYINEEEAATFANITMHMVERVQSGKLEVGIFKDAVEWAREAAAANWAKSKKAVFVSKIIKETGFKKQEKLL